MIELPKHITRTVLRVGNNLVRRCYGQEDVCLNNTNRSIITRDPFVVEEEGRRIFFTSSPTATVPNDCPYAILVNRNPTPKLFCDGTFKSYEWLKHPFINDALTPDEIAFSWRGKFTYIEKDDATGSPGLRKPQSAAIHAYQSKIGNLKDRANIVMPTGTGKTETMLGITIAAQCKKVLVTVPADALRDQIFNKFLALGCLHEFGIVTPDCKYPYVSLVDSGMNDINDWHSIIENSNVIVTTMSLVANATSDIQEMLAKEMTNVFVDEAHHSEASTWRNFLGKFERSRIIQFTATPFRNDGLKLKGEFIYTFSLREAQEQGYYQKINFNPVFELDREKADEEIAKQAIAILKRDREAGFEHILMARCKDTKRANEIFKYYEAYSEYNPVVIYSGSKGKVQTLEEIKRGEHKIIVCVNMLGEGFDLPQLKIAAVHDERQSLPITLQFIGRFTRTSGLNIGEASFVTNMAYPPLANDIRDLYLKDADWNFIIPGLNDKATDEQKAFAELLKEFPNIDQSKIPFQSINPALSTVIYRLDTMDWDPLKWETVFTEKDFDYRYADWNSQDDLMIIILGRLEDLDWSNFEGLQNRVWNVILLHKYDAGRYKHLYINSSMHGMSFDKLVEALFGTPQTMLDGDMMFKTFHGIHRLLVQNFGGRKNISGDVSFKSYVGRDVENGVSEAKQLKLIKNNIFASGIYDGEPTTHGCSKKGKIWSYRRGNLLMFKEWSHRMGRLVEDPSISEDELFKYTLKAKSVGSCPPVVPVSIDWDDDVYKNANLEQVLLIEGVDNPVYIFDANIEICPREWNLDDLPPNIHFQISYEDKCTKYCITYSSEDHGDSTVFGYKVEKISGPNIAFRRRQVQFGDITQYFNSEKRSPVVFFADGAMLYANNLIEMRETTASFDASELVTYDWENVSLKDESMGWPHETNTIQYYFWQRINEKHEFIFDDDGSGEIADLIGINQDANTIFIDLYHIKFAQGNQVSKRIDNFYAVCGQAQKSLKWKNPEMNIFKRMLERVANTKKGENRILKGNVDLLRQLFQEATIKKRIRINLHIVQPGLRKQDAPSDILHLLGVVKNYANDVCSAQLTVHCSR